MSKAKLTLLIPQNTTQHVVCVGVRPGGGSAHDEKLYNLGDNVEGGKMGLIKILQKWCVSTKRVLVAVMFDGIKKEQSTVWALLAESLKKGKGTLTSGVEYYHQLKSNRNACVFLGTAPPSGGRCVVDVGILLDKLPVPVVIVNHEYSDDLAAAFISPKAFEAIAASAEPMWAKYGTMLFANGMRAWQMAIDDRNPTSLAPVRCWFIWFGLFILNSFRMHIDTLRNNTAFALAALIIVGRECDVVRQPWRVTTRMQEGYHGEIRSASHMSEVSAAQLYDIVQSMNIVHHNCRKHGWHAWRATRSSAAISGAAARLFDHALPEQSAMSEMAIIAEGKSAALVVEKLLKVGGWKPEEMSDWIAVVKSAKSFQDFAPNVEHWRRQSLNSKDDAVEDPIEAVETVRKKARLGDTAVSVADDDVPLIEAVGRSCASAVGEIDPVEEVLSRMRETAEESPEVPGTDIAWESPSCRADITNALEKLANIPSHGSDVAEQALKAMLSVGLLQPMLPKNLSHPSDDAEKPYSLYGVATVSGLCHERSNTTIVGRFIKQNGVEGVGDHAVTPAVHSRQAITRGCIVLRLGTEEFYHVDTIAGLYGRRWFRSEADTTKSESMRMWCRKLMLVDGDAFRTNGTPVRCVFSFVHEGNQVRLDASDAHSISRLPHTAIVLYQEEKYLSGFAAPSPATDRDRVYLFACALGKIAGDLDVSSVPSTGEALLRGLLACASESVSDKFRIKLCKVLEKWEKLDLAKTCKQHFS